MIKTIKHGLNILKSKIRDVGIKQKRSPQWRKVETQFIESHPVCEICGSNKRLNVHHIKPFHLYPELELDVNNLITLCMDEKECHFKIGHGGDWKSYCEDVRLYVKEIKEKEKNIKQIYKIAEENRKK